MVRKTRRSWRHSQEDDQRGIPKSRRIIFWSGVGIYFKSIFDGFWPQLGTQNPPKMEPSWLPRAMKTATSENAKIIKTPSVFQWFWGFRGGRSWSQNLPKICPSGYQKQDQTFNGCSMAFGSILDTFWIDFGGAQGAWPEAAKLHVSAQGPGTLALLYTSWTLACTATLAESKPEPSSSKR